MNTSAHRDDAAGTLTRDVARYLALWMSYEDVIRVADMMAATRDDQYLWWQVAEHPDDSFMIRARSLR